MSFSFRRVKTSYRIVGWTSRAAAIALTSALAFAASALAQTAAGTSPAPAVRLLRAGDVDTMPVREPGVRIAYGTDSLQYGDLRLPRGRGPFAVAIILHGGCWYSPYAAVRNTAPLAQAITDGGVATWNVEYRRYDQPGGGWPGTFRDAADAADYVRTLAKRYPLDTARIVVAGHSAGAHLALWLASRHALSATSELAGGRPLALRGVVSIGGIGDLREFYTREKRTCGNPAVESLLGGVPDSVPLRVREASPVERLPLRVPSVHIAGERDFIAPRAVIESFALRARAAGDSIVVVSIPGEGHFEAIVPIRDAGRAVVAAVLRLAAPVAKRP